MFAELHPPHEEQLLVFWVGLVVLVATARGLGALARRVGQPAVVGELSAGLVLGPSVLGKVAPDAFDWLFPADDVQTAMIFTVGWLGVVCLLIVTGEETDLGLIRKLGRAAGVVSTGSLVVPMAAGLALGFVMPSAFLGEGDDTTVFALFMAAALSISSLPVIAKILTDMGFMRRNFGQLTLAAGMANDVIGWIVLGVVAGLAQAGAVEIGPLVSTLAGLAVFFTVAFTLGQRVLDWSLGRLRHSGSPPSAGTGVVLLAALICGAVTQWLGVEAVLGAFVAGVLLGRSRLRDHRIIEPIESVTATVLAPVFFSTAGLQVDLALLADGETLVWALAVLAVASLSKFIGSFVAARIAGLESREGAALGIGLNARGALEIVIATVGLSLGVLNQRSYTVIVLMAMATSMLAPPLLRRVLANWQGTASEQARLEQEERLESNVLVRAERVMLPARGGPNAVMAAQVLDLAWPKDVPVSLVTPEDTDEDALSVLHGVLYSRPVDRRDTDGSASDIRRELALGYGGVVIGSSPGPDGPLSAVAEEIARSSSVPVLIVRRGLGVTGRQPPAFGRVLVPVTGSAASQAAQELGSNISASIGTEAMLVHVTLDDGAADGGGAGGGLLAPPAPSEVSLRLLDDARERAEALGARTRSLPVIAASTSSGILRAATESETDLIVLGAVRRVVNDRLFLGHTVDRVLRESQATVGVIVLPPNGQRHD